MNACLILQGQTFSSLTGQTSGLPILELPDNFVFEIKPKTLQNIWRRYSGLKISLYEATRHSFCTQLVEMGINTLQAKELMRHSDVRSTEKYFHASVKKLGDIAEQRGKVVFLPSARN